MRHRARRPLFDLLPRLLSAPRGALVAVAVLVAGALGGVFLAVQDSPETVRAGAGVDRPGSAYSAPSSQGTEVSPRVSDRPSRAEKRSPSPSKSPKQGRTTEAPAEGESSATVPSADELASVAPDAPAGDPTGSRPTQGSPSPSPTQADPPQTTATTRSTNGNRWTITVASDEDATFECSLDGGGYEPCGTAVTYSGLGKGTHTFAARATAGGDTDPSPARLVEEIGGQGSGG
jgi:hypothetical protein